MVAAERLDKKMILPIFDYCKVAWHGCGKVNPDALESLQHGAAKLIFGNSRLDTKLELNDTFGLDYVHPDDQTQPFHIVLLTRKCLHGSVPPYLNNYFKLNASVHSVTTRRCNDIHIPKVKQAVAKRSFYFTGATEIYSPTTFIKPKKSFLDFS
ncbi:unnamed protein product, partial [Porites evermanni]